MFSTLGWTATLLSQLMTLQTLIPLFKGRDPPRLTPLAPLASKIGSVSGFSSGGAKAFQFYLSHSSELRGVGIFSGMIYECGLDAPLGLEGTRFLQCFAGRFDYTKCCDNLLELKVASKISKLADAGLFDPLDNVKSRRNFIHHGTSDNFVHVDGGDKIARFFIDFGSAQNVFYNRTDATHAIPTIDCGSPCPRKFPPPEHGCVKCGWSAAFSALNFIYNGTLRAPVGNRTVNQCDPADSEFSGLFTFDQREFFPPGSEGIINMGKTGYIYIPPRCQVNASHCTLHIHIHGCLQPATGLPGAIITGTSNIKCSGILRVAEANDIIVLFPQASFGLSSISRFLQCWDFVGYTGDSYGTKQGLQIKAIKNMFDRIMGVDFPLENYQRNF